MSIEAVAVHEIMVTQTYESDVSQSLIRIVRFKPDGRVFVELRRLVYFWRSCHDAEFLK